MEEHTEQGLGSKDLELDRLGSRLDKREEPSQLEQRLLHPIHSADQGVGEGEGSSKHIQRVLKTNPKVPPNIPKVSLVKMTKLKTRAYLVTSEITMQGLPNQNLAENLELYPLVLGGHDN